MLFLNLEMDYNQNNNASNVAYPIKTSRKTSYKNEWF